MKLLLSLLLTVSVAFGATATDFEVDEKPVVVNKVLDEGNTITLNTQFSDSSVAQVMSKALDLHLTLPEYETINLVMISPGGSVDSGINLINFLNSLNRKIDVICIWCASMAFQTFQGVKGNRYLTQYGTLMAHKASGGFRGEFPGQIEQRLKYWLSRLTQLDLNAVKRTKGVHTLASYRELYDDEYWCNDKECISQGFADGVANVTCGKGFTGLKSEVISTFFGQYKVFLSKCPLIDGIIKYQKLDAEGDPIGPFIKPSNLGNDKHMMSKKSIWVKMGIRKINAIDLNAR